LKIKSIALYALVAYVNCSCGGSGDGSNTPGDDARLNTVNSSPSCEYNQVMVEGDCQCPAHLKDKDGYCIDGIKWGQNRMALT
jgi:hypothetical protein